MSLQEEELVSTRTEQGSHAPSLLDEIMAQTRIQPGADGYDIARQGVTAFIASLLQSSTPAEPVNKLAVDSMIADIDARISRQMDAIIHAPEFQQLESFWRSMKAWLIALISARILRLIFSMSPRMNCWTTSSLRQKLLSPASISTFIPADLVSSAVNPLRQYWVPMSSKTLRRT